MLGSLHLAAKYSMYCRSSFSVKIIVPRPYCRGMVLVATISPILCFGMVARLLVGSPSLMVTAFNLHPFFNQYILSKADDDDE